GMFPHIPFPGPCWPSTVFSQCWLRRSGPRSLPLLGRYSQSLLPLARTVSAGFLDQMLGGLFLCPITRPTTTSSATWRIRARLAGYMPHRARPARPPQNGLSQHLDVRRMYLDEAGHVLTPPLTVKQGQRLFVALLARHTVEGMAQLANVALEDWLPAGLELENLRLLDTNALPALPEAWRTAQVLQPDYV